MPEEITKDVAPAPSTNKTARVSYNYRNYLKIDAPKDDKAEIPRGVWFYKKDDSHVWVNCGHHGKGKLFSVNPGDVSAFGEIDSFGDLKIPARLLGWDNGAGAAK